MQYVIGWNIQGKELLLLDAYSNNPRFFETKEEAMAVAKELETDMGKCRVLEVVRQETSDPVS